MNADNHNLPIEDRKRLFLEFCKMNGSAVCGESSQTLHTLMSNFSEAQLLNCFTATGSIDPMHIAREAGEDIVLARNAAVRVGSFALRQGWLDDASCDEFLRAFQLKIANGHLRGLWHGHPLFALDRAEVLLLASNRTSPKDTVVKPSDGSVDTKATTRIKTTTSVMNKLNEPGHVATTRYPKTTWGSALRDLINATKVADVVQLQTLETTRGYEPKYRRLHDTAMALALIVFGRNNEWFGSTESNGQFEIAKIIFTRTVAELSGKSINDINVQHAVSDFVRFCAVDSQRENGMIREHLQNKLLEPVTVRTR